MSEIMQFLKNIDEEYLIGLSNKGIVKRSHKDLESVELKVTQEGEEILGQYDEVSVRLKLPLTSSTCSCPSTSICKHVIMTILAAQRMAGDQPAEAPSQEEASPAEKAQDDGPQSVSAGESVGEGQALGESAQGSGRQALDENVQGSGQQANHLMQIPTERLRKAVSDREWERLLTLTQWETDFEITEGSMITVRDVKTQATVKLIHPMELSTCSVCHNDKLCIHKAAAILAWQIRSGVITPEKLMEEAGGREDDLDAQSVPEVLSAVKDQLEEMLLSGSARLSPETSFGLERLALRARGASLPNLEEKLRVLAECAKGYQERRASITASELMRRIVDCHLHLEKLERAVSEGSSILSVAGTFRSEYRAVPELMLYGIAMREFQSDAGYAGKTIFFFEERSRSFYTYTAVRPTTYEKTTRRGQAGEVVPWNLPCTLPQLSMAKVRIRDGKANDEKRLSSTSQAQAELLRVGGALPDAIGELIFDDFEELWGAYLERLNKAKGELSEAEKLFLIRPRELLSVEYDEITQRSVLWLEDQQGRRLRGELRFSKQEETAIRSLERMEQKIRKQGKELPVFFGSLYVNDGECLFYPIETIGSDRLGGEGDA